MKNKSFEIIKFNNGLTVVFQNIKYFNSITLVATVGAGPKYETDKTTGIAHFLEHMLFEGSKNYPSAKELAEYLENSGGKSGAWTDKEYVAYYVKITKGKLDTAFNYLEDILFNATLSNEAIEREKGIVLEEYKRGIDSPELDIWDNWLEWVWGKNQWLGRSTLGNEKAINSITQYRLKNYMKDLYNPSNMTIVVVGNFSSIDAKSLAFKYFANKKNSRIPVSQKIKYKSKNRKTNIVKVNTKQNQLMLGFVTGVTSKNKDRYVLRVISDILSMGVSSTIFNKLVYDLGIAYSVGAGNWSFSDSGLFFINGGFSTQNIEKALTVILEELNKLKRNGVSKKELDNAKNRDKAQLYFLLETSDALANLYAVQLITEGKITTPEEIIKQINLVRSDDVEKVARKYFTKENLSLTIRGPLKQNTTLFYDNIINGQF